MNKKKEKMGMMKEEHNQKKKISYEWNQITLIKKTTTKNKKPKSNFVLT